jgi:hypothetical protein
MVTEILTSVDFKDVKLELVSVFSNILYLSKFLKIKITLNETNFYRAQDSNNN